MELLPQLMESASFQISFHPNQDRLIELSEMVQNYKIGDEPDPFVLLSYETSPIVGYNKIWYYLSLSEPFNDSKGTFQLIEDKLYYSEKVIAFRNDRDSYRFATCKELYTSMDFKKIIKTLSDKYSLFSVENLPFYPERKHLINLNNAKQINFDSIF